MIQSVKRTFDILEYVAANGNLVRLNDIAQVLRLQKTTVHNFLAGLNELGYVEQDELTPPLPHNIQDPAFGLFSYFLPSITH